VKDDSIETPTMAAHLRANLILLWLTLLIGAVVYPVAILLLGQGLFKDKAEGSLLKEGDKVIGSRLLAQDFQQPQYFQPRPSSTGYDAAASGGSNLAPGNPRLRDRVARQLGPVVTDGNGHKIGPKVEEWVLALKNEKGEKIPPLTYWLETNPKLKEAWLSDNAEPIKGWLEGNNELGGTGPFFETFARRHPGAFPDVQEKKIVAVRDGAVLQGAFFDLWLQKHPEQAKELKELPADQVMTSGSGLDPHITFRNAQAQKPRVIDEWVKKGKGEELVRQTVETALEKQAFTPLLGNERLVNVLELNLSLRRGLENGVK
jgi:potassium-transporting ATPase KdpC subunit